MILGAQMYTVRNQCDTLEHFSETLKKIADIGYTTVQVSGTCSFEGEWLKEQLDSVGLKCVITHFDRDRIANETDEVARIHKIFGCDYVGIGWADISNNQQGFDSFVEKYKPAAKRLNELGMTLMYHNHDMELGKLPGHDEIVFETLSRAFTPEELGFTLDTFWVQAGGGDPAWWIRHFAGRLPRVHLKDMTMVDKERRMAPVGSGNMNFEAILKACEDAKIEYALVEQDDCYGEDPFDCLKKSYLYLKAQGLR